MYCSTYNEFYSLLASSTLILISIFVALSAILWQDKSRDKREIKIRIENLTTLINNFTQIIPVKDRHPDEEHSYEKKESHY